MADAPLKTRIMEMLEGLLQGGLTWQATRSEGPGGQNVNKRSTKIILRLELAAIEPLLPFGALDRLRINAAARINDKQELLINGSEFRTPQGNLAACMDRLAALIEASWSPPKRRKPTRATHASKLRRLEGKRRRSEVKRTRKPEE